MTALRTDAYDARLWVLDENGEHIVTRRYTGAEAALARAADEADDLELLDEEPDQLPLFIHEHDRDAALERLGLSLSDLPF